MRVCNLKFRLLNKDFKKPPISVVNWFSIISFKSCKQSTREVSQPQQFSPTFIEVLCTTKRIKYQFSHRPPNSICSHLNYGTVMCAPFKSIYLRNISSHKRWIVNVEKKWCLGWEKRFVSVNFELFCLKMCSTRLLQISYHVLIITKKWKQQRNIIKLVLISLHRSPLEGLTRNKNHAN